MATFHLFISHPWRRTPEYDSLVSLLDHAPGFDWVNYSQPDAAASIDPESESGRRVLIDALREQIRPVQCVVVLAGMYARHPEWVRTEMRIARQELKQLVGIRGWGAQWVPREVATGVDEMAFWNTPSITSVIRRWSW